MTAATVRALVALALALAWGLGASPGAHAQARPEAKPKTFLEEIDLFGYVESSYVWNMGKVGRDDVNELRVYDFDQGWSFNMAELSVKKSPSERYPFGFGLVVTAGLDAQKNHALGIFRDDDDAFPFRNTRKYDLQEAYGSYTIPVHTGITLKAGKFVTLLGYEVIESPNNLNFSRTFLYGFAIPFTHVGALASYAPVQWLSLTAGPVVGWDVADDNNDKLSWTGQVAFSGVRDLALAFNWITGPEQAGNGERRTVLDWTATWTGIKRLTLGLNVDWGFEDDEASLVAAGTRSDNDAIWWGWAAYAAWDWTERLRTALRVGYFTDPEGVRTLAIAAGSKVSLWEGTATVQYRIWKGLVGRLEFRHDEADEKVFKIRTPGLVPTGRTQDTLTVALSYSFF